MARFELSEGTSNKFWEIKLDGTSFTTTYGRIGSKGQSTTKSFKTPAEAKRAYEMLIGEKVMKGYAPAGGGVTLSGKSVPLPPKPKPKLVVDNPPVALTRAAKAAATERRNPALERAIVANPYDTDAYMVYADWLQDQGDPRGELIALQIAGKAAAAKKLLARHADGFLGALADHQKCHDRGKRDAFTWQYGFIHRVRLAHDHYAEGWSTDGARGWDGSLAEVLDLLLRHPSGRFIAELTMNYNGDPNEDTLDDLIGILAKRAPATLRKLRIGDDVDQISWYKVGNLGKLWKAVPNLTHFDIEAGEFTLGTIALPKLVHAVFATGGLAKASAKAIAAATWPNIEHLEVYYGDESYGGNATIKDVLPLLARTDLPKLRYLGVKNAMFQDALCEHLATSKLLRQLATLDLSCGILTDDGAATIARHRQAFAHLAVLDISRTYVTKQGIALLKGVAKQVIAKDMRADIDDDPDDRYVAVGE